MKKVNVSELRIGNIINGVYQLEESNDMHYSICKFLGYHPFDNYIYIESKDGIEEFIQFQPIDISEEILLKCGFVYTDEDNEYMSLVLGLNYKFISSDKSINFNSVWLNKEIPYTLREFKYLHQLQNLYFALTGQELNTSGL